MGALPSTWRSQVPLAPLTTLQVGGPAQYYVETRSTDELLETLRVADRQRLAVTVLGGGSNVLISDDGIDGVVIRQRDVRVEPLSQRRVRVSAGTEWDPFVHWAVQHGLAGLECLSGIPGQVGAAPIQNVGAYGRDVSEVLRSVTVVNRSDGSVSEMSAEACEFGYRSSVFKSHRDRYLVTAVTFELAESSTCELRYRDLLAEFPERVAPIADVRAAVLRIRARKSMVWDPEDPNHRSAGSFFVNPVVSVSVADRIDEATSTPAPRFPTSTQDVKIPAAWLIEQAGFHKGHVRGRAGISSAHALALINRGGASAREIEDLAADIQKQVRSVFGVDLVPEPVRMGFTGTG